MVAQNLDYVAFNILLDDLVFPDGQTRMGVLGGGGPQTALGMRLWSDRVGLVGGVGQDFPRPAEDWLQQAGIDCQGLRRSELPTARAWQVTETSGLRTQVWRVGPEVIRGQLQRRLEYLPSDYRQAKGYHLGVHPLSADYDFIAGLVDLGGVVSVESFCPAARQLDADGLKKLVGAADIFSLNEHEARSLVGEGQPQQLAQRLLDAGARLLCLRLGAAGALVADSAARQAFCIPACAVPVVDVVGAGNAFCGGFLAGWCQTGNLLTAGICGAVAASFLVEQVGLPVFSSRLVQEAQRRLEGLRLDVTPVNL